MGQGVANIATGFIGGMAGCAMIGQSVINVKSGGRGRLSTLVAGVMLLILVVFLGDWVRQIPMAALVAVMIMVSIGTFNWGSFRNLREHPKSSSVVMLATVLVTVYTHDLARGVLVGVLLSGFFFAHKIGQILMLLKRQMQHFPHWRRHNNEWFLWEIPSPLVGWTVILNFLKTSPM